MDEASEKSACPSCGSSTYDEDIGLIPCPFCGMSKCSECDSGEGEPCLLCDEDEED